MRKQGFLVILLVLFIFLLGAYFYEDVNITGNLNVTGAGTHSIGGADSEGASILNIGGSGFNGGTTDIRAVNINPRIITRALYSSEGINTRPGFVLPNSGQVASLEGNHVDLSNIDWSPGGTVGGVYAFRARGVPLNSKASEAVAFLVEAGWAANVPVAYNIWSQGATARNRIDGNLEVYGTLRYDMVATPPQGSSLRGYIKIKIQGVDSYLPYYQ